MKAGRAIIVGVALVSSVFVLIIISFFITQESCSKGTFKCGNTSSCVPQKSMCNGYVDCPNGEDELAKTCADFHGSDFVKTLLMGAKTVSLNYHTCGRDKNGAGYTGTWPCRKRRLIPSDEKACLESLPCLMSPGMDAYGRYNKTSSTETITVVVKLGLANVPTGCTCRNQTYVYCKNMKLTQVPAGISENVTRLAINLSYGWIPAIYFPAPPKLNDECHLFHSPRFLMKGEKLDTFNASGNGYLMMGGMTRPLPLNLTTWVSPTKVTRVFKRIIANNTIKYPKEDAFALYPQLHLIHLEGNQIESLPSKIFRNQGKLVKLLLMNNRLKSLEENLFQGLQFLRILFLQNNLLEDSDLNALLHTRNLQMLDLSKNRIQLKKRSFPLLPHLMDLVLDENLIEDIHDHTLSQIPSVQFLGLRRNRIKYIQRNAFRRTPNLKELDLSNNYLSTLPESVFSELMHLTKLFIGRNPLYKIPSHLFASLHRLSSLGLEDIEINNIDIDMFATMTSLEFIYLKKFYYCSFVPTVPKCEPKTDGLSTVDNLLGRKVLRVTVWIVALVTCIGNVYVFWERLTTRDENRVLSWIVRNLAVSDFFMGIYLLVIGAKDVEYRGIYQQVSHEWISSWTCTIVGVLAMISSEVSIFILVFMSFERFILIAVPFGGHQNITPKTSFYSLAIIWTFGVSMAVIPVIQWRNSTRFYGANGLCFPLHLDDPYFAGWQFSAFVFIGINLSGLLVIGILYSGMFWSIWKTRHATTLNVGDFEFAIRFFFIVLTNTACWAPIIVLKILAFFRIYISAEAYSWVSVFVMPVNSAFNPLLYTLTTPKYREIIKYNFSRRMKPLDIISKNRAKDVTYSQSSGNKHETPFCTTSGQSADSKTNSFDMPTFNTSVDRSSSTGYDDGSQGTGFNSRGNSLDLPIIEHGESFTHGDIKFH